MEETNTQNVTDATVVEETTAVSSAPATNKLKTALLIIVIGVVLSGGLYYVLKNNADTVAVVNGVKITQTEFADSVRVITQNATLQGADATDPAVQTEINKQAIDVLINNELLIGGARAAGITADEAKVQSEYDKLVEQVGGAEELKTRMAEVGLTEEKLRSNITDRIIADSFIESKTDIETLTVSDEEIQTFLTSIKTEGTELPPLDEIRPQIESQILGQKRQELVTTFLASLRESATIEIKLEGLE